MAKSLERPERSIGRRRLWAAYFPDARGRMWGRVHGEGGEFPGVLARMHGRSQKARLEATAPHSPISLPGLSAQVCLASSFFSPAPGKSSAWPECRGRR